MSSFLTVEDVNSIVNRFSMNGVFHSVDTGLISSSLDFDDIQYDFVLVSRVSVGDSHTYSFEVVNSNWTGEYYFLDSEGEYIDADATYDSTENVLSFTTGEDSVTLVLYCTGLHTDFSLSRLTSRFNEDFETNITLDQLGVEFPVEVLDLVSGEIGSEDVTISNLGVFSISLEEDCSFFFLSRLVKTDFEFECTSDLVCGRVNSVPLGASPEYKPGGSLVGDDAPTISVSYDGVVSSVVFDDDVDDYVFDLDLTNLNTPDRVEFIVNVTGNHVVNTGSFNVRLVADYRTIYSGSELREVMTSDEGESVIRLGANMSQVSGLVVSHDLRILGDNHYLENSPIIVDTGVTFEAEDTSFIFGSPAITQEKNSTVNLTECVFNNNYRTDMNNLGTCIYCNIDDVSLNNPNDYATNLTKCIFTTTKNAIYHGGQLTVENCLFYKDYHTLMDNNGNPSFLYMADGDASITESYFNIDFHTNILNKNIGYGQALFVCGENATINGMNHTQLQEDRTGRFFLDKNNSHIFAKYYYPSIEDNVVSSPVVGFEEEAVCWGVSGVDWVFKANVQVTRVGGENPVRRREVVLPSGLSSVKAHSFRACEDLSSIVLPDGISSIGDNCFYYCEGLESINIPDSVISLGDSCFWGCSSLSSIVIPDSVTSLGDSCFGGCIGLSSISLPDSVTSLGNYCFYNCEGLESISLPDSVTSLGNNCFTGCTSLSSIVIPDSVTSLGDSCFYNCSSLSSIVLNWDTPTEIIPYKSNWINNTSNNLKFSIPANTTTYYTNKGYPANKIIERSQ